MTRSSWSIALTQRAGGRPTSGELAVFGSALHWEDGSLMPEREAPPPADWGSPNEDILLLRASPGRYELRGEEIDRETFGLAVWRLVPLSR